MFSIPESITFMRVSSGSGTYFGSCVSQSLIDLISSVIFLSPSIHKHRDSKGKSNSASHSDVYVTLSYSSKQRHMVVYKCFSPI